MADAEALDRALLPLLRPGPVLLDGYPRTMPQLVMLPGGFSVVMLDLDRRTAEARARAAAEASGKAEWPVSKRYDEQLPGLEQVRRQVDLIVDVTDKTLGEVLIEILSSKYIGPPPRWAR